MRFADHCILLLFIYYKASQLFNGLFFVFFCLFFLSSCRALCCHQPLPTAELDGTVSGDFFTVLCVGQGFTEDQWMNVYSFSMLRHWLLTYHSVSNNAMDTGTTTPLTQTMVFCLYALEKL